MLWAWFLCVCAALAGGPPAAAQTRGAASGAARSRPQAVRWSPPAGTSSAARLAAPSDPARLAAPAPLPELASPAPAAPSSEPGMRESLGELAGLAGSQAAAPSPDLSPAGPELTMTPETIERLRPLLLDSAQPVLSPGGFQALVEGTVEPDFRRAKEVSQWLSAMHQTLAAVINRLEPGDDRAAIALALTSRFTSLLRRAEQNPSLHAEGRRLAARARASYLDTRLMVEELSLARQASLTYLRVDAVLRRHEPAPVQGAEEASLPEWSIPEPFPESRRVTDENQVGTLLTNPREAARQLKHLEFLVERVETQARIIEQPPFSKGFRQRYRTHLEGLLPQIRNAAERYRGELYRIAWLTLNRGLAPPAHRRLVQIPRHQGLELISEPGGYRLEVRFYTDIREPAVLQVAKDSIESYWKGTFSMHGRTLRWRTRVSITELAEGAPFPADALELRDGGVTYSHARGRVLALGRRHLPYAMPAHEFGHILGLPDEYDETFDTERRVGVETQLAGSLMGSNSGVVQPRHFELAFRLLRRGGRIRSGDQPLPAGAMASPRYDAGPTQPSAAPPSRPEEKPPAPSGIKGLVAAHSLGIFNDAALKSLFALWVAATLPAAQAGVMISLGTALLIAPFLFFSFFAGRLTDRVDKGKLVIGLKVVELGLAALAGAALAFHSVWAMLGLLFLMGTHTALMGPAKYALLPERVRPADLSEANGTMELGSFVAFMGGTAAGGLLYMAMASALPLTSAVFGAVAVAGILASLTLRGAGRAVSAAPAAALSPARPWLPKGLWGPAAGVGLFWFLTSLLQMNIFLFGQHTLKIGEGATTGLLAGAGVAMGIGSFLAGKLSQGKVQLGLAPWGLLGLTAFMLDLALFGAGSWVRAAVDLAGLSVSAGLFYIPLNSYIQQQSPPEARGRILGASNFLSYGAILLSAGLYFALTAWAGLTPAGIFLAGAAIAAAALAPVGLALGPQALAFARDFLNRGR